MSLIKSARERERERKGEGENEGGRVRKREGEEEEERERGRKGVNTALYSASKLWPDSLSAAGKLNHFPFFKSCEWISGDAAGSRGAGEGVTAAVVVAAVLGRFINLIPWLPQLSPTGPTYQHNTHTHRHTPGPESDL